MSVLDLSSFDQRPRTRYGAYCYLRVSDPSQAERKNSLEQQERQIRRTLDGLGVPILKWFKDEGKSAFKDHEGRDDFWRMIEEAKADPRCGYIAVDDESRFFRNKYETAKVKGELLEYGIRTITSTRTADPRTVHGLWMETIEETAAHADSIMRGQYTMRGMKGNIHKRDEDTGWAFKNGPAPYGWKARRIHLGNDARGRPIDRTIWELDEPKAAVRRQILIWRKEGKSLEWIRDELNRQRIPAPRSHLWGTSTIKAMLNEDMIWTAAGYGIWNKYHRKHRVKGEKFKPTDEWEVEPNAHPAIISEEDAQAIIAVGRERTKSHKRGRRKEQASPYLLSGDNAQESPLFICGACGSRMIGNNPGGRNRRKYVCSTKMYKGAQHCPSVRIDAERLEQAVLDVLRGRFTREYMLAVIRAANEEIKRQRPAKQVTDVREARLREIETQLKRIRDSILAGIDPSVWADQSKQLAHEKAEIEASLAEEPPKKEPETALQPIPEDRAEELADRVGRALAESATLDEQKRIIKALVQQMTLTSRETIVYLELTPDPLDLRAPTLFAMYGDNLVPPTGRAPIAIHIDA